MSSYSKICMTDIETDAVPSIETPIVVKPLIQKTRERRRRRAWKLFRVLGLVVCALFGLAGLAGIWFYRAISRGVLEWTVADPGQPLPVVPVPQEELDVFAGRAEWFFDAIQGAGKVPSPEDLVVSARVANGFFAGSDFLGGGHAFAEMDINEVRVSLSLPMQGLPGGKGRFLVGTETLSWDPEVSSLHAHMEDEDSGKIFYDLWFHLKRNDDDKALHLELLSGQFLHWIVPQDFIDEHHNLLEDIYHCDRCDEDCKHTRKILDSLSEVSFEKDQVVVRTKKEAIQGQEGNRDHHHEALLADADNRNPTHWKFRLARHLVGV